MMIFPASLSQGKRIGNPSRFPVLPVGGVAFVGALDGIPNLVHIYCPARRWVSTYNDFAIEIMNADTDAIGQFGYTAAGDVDAAAITSWLSGSNGLIRTVPDQILGDHVTQTTKNAMPLFVASGQGGRAVGRYNGTSHWMRGAFTTISQPFQQYIVAKINGVISSTLHLINGVGTNIAIFINTSNNIVMFAGVQLGATGTTYANDQAWHVLAARFDGANSYLAADGTIQYSGNAGTSGLANGITIANNHLTPPTAPMPCDTATVIVAGEHDTANRQAVEAAINDYYAIF